MMAASKIVSIIVAILMNSVKTHICVGLSTGFLSLVLSYIVLRINLRYRHDDKC